MALRRFSTVIGLLCISGCYAPPDAPPSARSQALETTGLIFQAVDAGTGSALADAELTVRYLIRAPIVFDAASVERVASIEPYEISHELGEDNLVVEVRLEADSYHRLDTVLTVARGQSAGPLTMRMSRRLDRLAQGGATVAPSGPAGSPDAGRVADADPVVTGGGVDRTRMRTGDRAFSREAWLEATEAYQQMPEPVDEMNEYGRAFLTAKIQQGVAHVNRSEFGRALEIFEEAVELESPGPNAYLHLAEAQCAVGRSEEGRGTLSQLSRARSGMRPVQQSYVAAMIAYQRAVCSHGEFDRAETTRDRVRAGAQATQQLNAFVEGARAMSPVPPDVYNAVLDSERRVLEIRRLMGGGR